MTNTALQQNYLDELKSYVVSDPYPFVIDLANSSGMYLATIEGKRLFDWAGYFGAKLIGHNHPGLYEPEYVKRLVLAANNKVANPDFLTLECLEYYRMVHRLAPEVMKNPNLEVYCVNSGAEAVENMMKYLVSRYNHKARKKGLQTGQRRFLYFDKAFHGRTVFALGVTQTTDPVATKDFHGLTTTGNIKLPFPAFDSGWSREENLRQAQRALEQVESALSLMSDEIIGIIIEPIQGAGGHRVALPEFFQGLSELAHRYDVYLAFDEVQTGLGATGKMWGLDHFNLPHPPIAVASGKKFGTGVVYMYEPLEDLGVLDSTWGGTLADMVRVVHEVNIVESEGLIEKARINGDYLAKRLGELTSAFPDLVFNVRGLGLYQGISLRQPEWKRQLIEIALQKFDLLLLGAGSRTIRTRPNLSVTKDDIDRFHDLMSQSLAELAASV